MRHLKEIFDINVLNDYHNSFYYLGFLAADGDFDLSTKTPRIRLELSIKDKQILEDLAVWLKYKYKVRDVKSKKSAILAFSSNILYNFCCNYGINKNKSLDISMKLIPEYYKKDFLRGFVDGDGSWSGGRVTFCTSSISFKQEIINYWNSININQYNLSETHKKEAINYNIQYCVEESKRIAVLLYKTGQLKLLRKYNLAQESFNKIGRKSVEWHREVIKLFNEGNNAETIANLVEHTSVAVRVVLKKNGLGRFYKTRADKV